MRTLKSRKRFLTELHPPNHPVITRRYATTHGISCSDHRGNLHCLTLGTIRPDSAVSTATRLRQRQDSFILFKMSRQDLWLPSLLFNGQRYSFPGVKRPGIESEHSPPSSVEVTNEWSYASTPPVCIHGGHRENFIFHALGSILNVRYIYGKLALLYFL